MTFLNAIDNPLLVALYASLSVFVVAHMNRMHRGTPKMEVAAWWFLGVGSFAIVIFDIHGSRSEWGHIMFGLGAALLVGLHTQPEWRPFLANRRRQRAIIKEDNDRRCRGKPEAGRLA